MPSERRILGVLLAGGLSRRMGGGDKCLRPLAGRPILAHVIDRARPQVAGLVLNANGDLTRFAGFGLPVAADVVDGFAGPLAGVLTGLDWARSRTPAFTHVVTFATDTPFLPVDLVDRLIAAAERDGTPLAAAASDGQAYPVFGLWPVSLAADLRRALVDEGMRKVDLWTARHGIALADFATDPIDPFFNTNRPEDLAAAERMARALERDDTRTRSGV